VDDPEFGSRFIAAEVDDRVHLEVGPVATVRASSVIWSR
jgi:hypothetical protein